MRPEPGRRSCLRAALRVAAAVHSRRLKVISMIASASNGAAWLLDPQVTSVSVGWAYQPGGGASAGQYECAILKFG